MAYTKEENEAFNFILINDLNESERKVFNKNKRLFLDTIDVSEAISITVKAFRNSISIGELIEDDFDDGKEMYENFMKFCLDVGFSNVRRGRYNNLNARQVYDKIFDTQNMLIPDLVGHSIGTNEYRIISENDIEDFFKLIEICEKTHVNNKNNIKGVPYKKYTSKENEIFKHYRDAIKEDYEMFREYKDFDYYENPDGKSQRLRESLKAFEGQKENTLILNNLVTIVYAISDYLRHDMDILKGDVYGIRLFYNNPVKFLSDNKLIDTGIVLEYNIGLSMRQIWNRTIGLYNEMGVDGEVGQFFIADDEQALYYSFVEDIEKILGGTIS